MNELLNWFKSSDLLAWFGPILFGLIVFVLSYIAGKKQGIIAQKLENAREQTQDAEARTKKIAEQKKREDKIDEFYDKLDRDLPDFTE